MLEFISGILRTWGAGTARMSKLRRTRSLVAGCGEPILRLTIVPMRLLILEGGGRLVTTARRICLQACHTRYPHLYRYFIAVARILRLIMTQDTVLPLTLLFGLLVLWLTRQSCRKPCAVLLLRPVLIAFWLDLYSYTIRFSSGF